MKTDTSSDSHGILARSALHMIHSGIRDLGREKHVKLKDMAFADLREIIIKGFPSNELYDLLDALHAKLSTHKKK